MRHLAPPEEQGDLHLVALLEELASVVQLHLEVVLVRLRPEPDALDTDPVLLLPRLLLLIYGITIQTRALNKLNFSHSTCDRLIKGMQVPQMETGEIKISEPGKSHGRQPTLSISATVGTADGPIHMIIGVPEETDALYADDELTERIVHLLGPGVFHRLRLTMDPQADALALQRVQEGIKSKDTDIRVLFIQDAWLPPIRETLSWIRAMRHTAGPRTGIIIGLLGAQ